MCKHGVFRDSLHHGRIAQDLTIGVSSHHGGQIEPKTVHVHFSDPVVQAVHYQVSNQGMIAVKSIATACKVEMFPGFRVEHVVNRVVYTSKAVYRSVGTAFRRMIEHYVQDYLDAGLVKGFDHLFKFSYLVAVPAVNGKGGLG